MILPLRTITNPDFPVDGAHAMREHARMRSEPVRLARPVVVLAGWRAPHFSPLSSESVLRPLTSGRRDDFLSVSYANAAEIQVCLDAAVKAIAERFPGDVEVDVAAISMGGLVARKLLAMGAVRVKRLFTMATPHRGASMARVVRPDWCAADMRPGSALLRELDAALPTLRERVELRPYAALRDWWVGARHCAPTGMGAYWIDPVSVFGRTLSHFAINREPRVLMDIARCLRGEEPLARAMSTPPME